MATSTTLPPNESSTSRTSTTSPHHDSPASSRTISPLREEESIPEPLPEAIPEPTSDIDKMQAAPADTEAGSSSFFPAPKVAITCDICNDGKAKYKCPRTGCTVYYCCVDCYRRHRENHPADPAAPAPAPAPVAPAVADPSDQDPFHVLIEHAEDIKRLFGKYPGLEAHLGKIANGSRAPVAGARGQQQSEDARLQRDAAALRIARTDPSELGDGVREYCELVLALLNGPKGDAMAASVRTKVEVSEMQVIKQLMAAEAEKGDWD